MKEKKILLLDISNKVCPMTTVYVRNNLDFMENGEKLIVTLRGKETLNNVKKSVEYLGFKIFEEKTIDLEDYLYQVSIIKIHNT
ncbi:sulfurtransferase TusA family protein [Swingsia samuiensis]|uniref:Sulfurtransferase TusA family protein n=1 Tax=Swingsia samuiensis TaxID=1293412 RepID=A0A4Y6UL29_9PROT|nr:sulfurtransferase TusA family protein [Swingsia samuiensis]QDH17077.1 sulfurtransferase TusA family protein [Swingsia samuiensis]